MKFYDKVQIVVQSGKGGNGATAARREAGVPYGGPSGGNGGHGGSVILQADANYNTLLHLKFVKEWIAKEGAPGESSEKYGKSADDLIIYIPVGSLIRLIDEEHNLIIYHFTKHGEEFVICKGGIGGAGNMHFKNSLVQFPDFALEGEPGQKKTIEIELQLLADVALIGMPSVGKSSIINSLSNSKAKVAEYHFTTLIPNLGSVSYENISRNIIDIPGLVEGASEGKGLGNEFLRHVLKARLFCFVMDVSRWDSGIQEFGILWNEIISYIKSRFQDSSEFGYQITDVSFELMTQGQTIVLFIKDQYGKTLLQKGITRIINKIDESQDIEILNEYRNHLMKHIIDSIGITGNSIDYKMLSEQIILYSTILEERKSPLLSFMKNKLSNVEEFTVSFEQENIDQSRSRDKKQIEYIGELEDPDIQDILYDLGFQPQVWDIDLVEQQEEVEENEEGESDTDKQEEGLNEAAINKRKLRKLLDHEVARLSYQLPRGKILAEERFWRVMKQQGLHKRLNKNGVNTGDLLRIESDYNSNKHIVFPYMLSGKTSYKHQKLT